MVAKTREDNVPWLAAIDVANKEVVDLMGERELVVSRLHEIDSRLSVLCHGVNTLSDLAHVQIPDAVGEVEARKFSSFTGIIRDIVRRSSHPVTPRSVRDAMLKAHVALDAYSQPLATIHLVLKRLLKQKEIRLVGKNEYRWGNAASQPK